jgi:hypothetical protein
LKCLADYRRQLRDQTTSVALFPEPPVLDFTDHPALPKGRARSLRVLKTQTRRVTTLPIGKWLARETIWWHPRSGREYPSAALRRLVAPGCNYGYDVLVYVGRALFLETQPIRVIIAELARRQVHLSPSTVAELGRRFIVLLTLAHRQCAPHLKAAMRGQGGYILHLDATYEDQSPLLMTGMDAVLEIVLGNIKLPSEKAEGIVPFLRQLQADFGSPLAIVRDMSKGIAAAIKEVFPDAPPDFICHFHFLRDLGKDLLGAEYDTLRQGLKKHRTAARLHARLRTWKKTFTAHRDLLPLLTQTRPASLSENQLQALPLLGAYTLAHWVLAGLHQGHGYGFPFDRPLAHLAQRAQQVFAQLPSLQDLQLRGQWRDNLPWHQLRQDLQPLLEDRPFWKNWTLMNTKAEVFDQLRQAFHLASELARGGLNHEGEDVPMGVVETQVRAWREQLLARPQDAATSAFTAMLAQLNQYWSKLFAPPLIVDTPSGPRTIQPQRTNNLMERFFRDLKRGCRRKTGQNALGRTLRTMLAQTPLANNLRNETYLKILLDDHDTLEDLFAAIDPVEVRQEMRQATQNPEKIPAQLKRFIAKLSTPAPIKNFFEKLKSNGIS